MRRAGNDPAAPRPAAGDLSGQVFVFFILTVAAAESAIGLAILVVLFRQRKSINVEDLDAMRG
jgi:NADH-quinone oxidoreductase subunit K